MRGKEKDLFEILSYCGITPACAGKSAYRLKIAITSQDHPRVCGEKPFSASLRLVPVGSPPRVRGKAYADECDIKNIGITPACAGKRMAADIVVKGHRDHPRVCGEKTKKIP